MAKGYFFVKLSSADEAYPITSASVTTVTPSRIVTQSVDEDGKTEIIEIETPEVDASLDPDNKTPPYTAIEISVEAPSFVTQKVAGIQIFPEITSMEVIDMNPLPITSSPLTDIDAHFIPPSHFITDEPGERPPKEFGDNFILDKAYIPDRIIVHLGRPDDNGRNITIPFIDYIKNVASSEIYPTWPENSIKANVYAQISLALNRIYTEWYRSKGYSFQITNSPSYDQAYVDGRNIFENVAKIVDDIFNEFIKLRYKEEPYFAEYCDGKTVTCKGMSQWGTVTLANNGYTPLAILRNYYGDDIILATTNLVEGVPQSYPGYSLKLGSESEEVRIIQRQLNRIKKNYPEIPYTQENGIFGTDTEAAVKRFQKIFSLTQDGIVGKSSWYKISYIYISVKRLALLTTEGEQPGYTTIQYPGFNLKMGMRGLTVAEIQYFLDFISNNITDLPIVDTDGIYGTATMNAVEMFQRKYSLPVTGIVDEITWDRIYNVYLSLQSTIPEISDLDAYPGTPLRVGDKNSDVLKMQVYLNVIRTKYKSIIYLTEDGGFGTRTQTAVKEFQRLFSLTADGVIGENTWNSIVSEYRNILSAMQ